MCDPNYRRVSTTTGPSGSATVCVSSNALSSCNNESSTGQPPKDNAVYLQTFRTELANNDRRQCVRGILDGGSQRSFIKEDVARKLSLKVVRQTRLALNTFGSTCSSAPEKRNVVEIQLQNRYNMVGIRIEAVVVPAICHDLTVPSANSTLIRESCSRTTTGLRTHQTSELVC